METLWRKIFAAEHARALHMATAVEKGGKKKQQQAEEAVLRLLKSLGELRSTEVPGKSTEVCVCVCVYVCVCISSPLRLSFSLPPFFLALSAAPLRLSLPSPECVCTGQGHTWIRPH